jgi:hypothetical protein
MSEGNLRACSAPNSYEGKVCSSVKCDNGHAIHVYEGSLAEAIAAWNTRADDWQDIATAPRDGTRFDVWVPAGGGYRVTELRATSQGSLIDKRGCLADLPCWPTHWRPLPAAPQVSA